MAPPPYPEPGTLKARLMNRVVAFNTLVYRISGGRIGGKTGGAPILLLAHKGRKSGEVRTAPVCYTEVGPDLVVIASRAGSDHDPAWWLNLKASPQTTVTIGKQERHVVAREAEGEERERLWAEAVKVYPDYEVYRERTSRHIPVVVLSPA